MKKPGIRAAIVAVLMLVTGVGTAGYASAASASQSSWVQRDGRVEVRQLSTSAAADLQRQIDDTLRTTTGGVQVSANEIAYQGGNVVLSLPLPGQRTAPASSKAALALTEPAASSAAGAVVPYDAYGCPAGASDNRWYCFYQDANFGGWRLQWNYQHCDVQHGDYLDFVNYNFAAETSSWVNTGTLYVFTFDAGWYPLWTENPAQQPGYTASSYVGNEENDRAFYAEAC
ncbi:hypothetical protein ABH920_002648 [Catenulispora sp. EB89]|uniref:hypothetical protein n=1 Tax=Catenulispora sp. EB89 TaxID=3156257 RepID=UPI0035132E7C